MIKTSIGELLAEAEPVFTVENRKYTFPVMMTLLQTYNEDPGLSIFRESVDDSWQCETSIRTAELNLPTSWVMDVLAERVNQIDKWGLESNEPTKWVTILAEELGEVSEAVLQNKDSLKHELIQLVTAGVAWLEQLEKEES